MIYLLSPTEHEDAFFLPMIEFSLVEKSLDVSSYELLIFTSKQAVKSAQILNHEWKSIPSLAVGKATAKAIKQLGGAVHYVTENSYVEELGRAIVKEFKQKKILYLRAKEISFNLKKYLEKNSISLDEKVIYKTECIKYNNTQKPPKGAVIIFTSPSTIRCFLKNFEWESSYRAVVIGNETKKHLPSNVTAEVASSPQIEACIDKAKEILLFSNSK
jgi:uroporphyrinogen-III synthase